MDERELPKSTKSTKTNGARTVGDWLKIIGGSLTIGGALFLVGAFVFMLRGDGNDAHAATTAQIKAVETAVVQTQTEHVGALPEVAHPSQSLINKQMLDGIKANNDNQFLRAPARLHSLMSRIPGPDETGAIPSVPR